MQSGLNSPDRLLENMPMARKTVIVYVNDKMQRGYTYVLTVRSGRNFDPEFRPELTPKEMLALGAFCGKYMTDCRDEFPASWFARARLSPSGRNCSLNYFGVDASQSLAVWRCKGWIVLPLLHGAPHAGGGRVADQAVEGYSAPHRPNQTTLRAW
jgi:hypothetical protein